MKFDNSSFSLSKDMIGQTLYVVRELSRGREKNRPHYNSV